MCLPLFRCPVCLNVYMKPRGAYVENTCIDHIISDRLTKVWVYVTYTLTCTLVLRTVRTSRTRLGFRSLRSLRAFVGCTFSREILAITVHFLPSQSPLPASSLLPFA